MKKYPFKVGDRVMTPDGRGTVVKHDVLGLNRPGVLHDVFPDTKPRMYKDDILYYFEFDFKLRVANES